MSDFAAALDYTMKHEGGWANDPDDPGGATMFGVTLGAAKRHGVPSADALRGISIERAAEILRADYWRFDAAKDQRVATKLFDMAVNMGLATAVKRLQASLNVYGAGLCVDGAFGARTAEAVNSRDPDLVLDLLCGTSREHYERIASRRPASKKSLKG